MGKRYYCDYCERSFIDDVESRKKHLNAVNHQRLKKLHYSSFRDLKTLIKEERGKVECKRFKKNGECPFAENCNYSHYSEAQLIRFEIAVIEMEKSKEASLPSIEDWLLRREKAESTPSKNLFAANNPLNMYNYNLLPMSLREPTEEDIISTSFEEWG